MAAILAETLLLPTAIWAVVTYVLRRAQVPASKAVTAGVVLAYASAHMRILGFDWPPVDDPLNWLPWIVAATSVGLASAWGVRGGRDIAAFLSGGGVAAVLVLPLAHLYVPWELGCWIGGSAVATAVLWRLSIIGPLAACPFEDIVALAATAGTLAVLCGVEVSLRTGQLFGVLASVAGIWGSAIAFRFAARSSEAAAALMTALGGLVLYAHHWADLPPQLWLVALSAYALALIGSRLARYTRWTSLAVAALMQSGLIYAVMANV